MYGYYLLFSYSYFLLYKHKNDGAYLIKHNMYVPVKCRCLVHNKNINVNFYMLHVDARWRYKNIETCVIWFNYFLRCDPHLFCILKLTKACELGFQGLYRLNGQAYETTKVVDRAAYYILGRGELHISEQ